jgi:hypothetical protein
VTSPFLVELQKTAIDAGHCSLRSRLSAFYRNLDEWICRTAGSGRTGYNNRADRSLGRQVSLL